MNRQTSKLLAILLNSPGQFFHYEDLASRLGVSTRSIRNYIQSIQDFLKEQNLSASLDISNGGISFTGDSSESGLLLEAAVDNEFYFYKLSPDERGQLLFLLLLASNDYCNLFELSEKLNVSRTTLLKDIEQVKRYLSEYGIRFAPSMNKGYRIEVGELQRREIILRLVRSSMGSTFSLRREVNIYERFLYDEWNLESYFPEIRTLLLEAEETYDLEVTDTRFDEMIFVLSLTVGRLCQGEMIEETLPFNSLGNKEAGELSAHILRHLSILYHFTYNEAEICFLASQFRQSRFYHHPGLENAWDVRLHVALNSFLIKISHDISIPVHQDAKIVDQLENHLRDIDKAHEKGIFLENDYTGQMIEEYPDIYQLICRHISVLESASGRSYSKDDIALILIYLVVAIDRHYEDNLPPGVILVCHTGIGTANFLAEQLKNFFNIRILAVTSNHKLADVKKIYDYDFILSTVSLSEPEDTWVKVSPMLEDEDIIRLQKIFIGISRRKKQPILAPPLAETAKSIPFLLKEENILLDVACQDWKEVISKSSTPLLMDGSIDSRYTNAMIQSCETNGAYFVYCPGVALAHADPKDGVHFFGLSLLRLKNPVCFGHDKNDPVSWCICMAVPRQNEHIQDVFTLMDLLGDPVYRARMAQIPNRKELLSFIKNIISGGIL